jgi:hypothetical protein
VRQCGPSYNRPEIRLFLRGSCERVDSSGWSTQAVLSPPLDDDDCEAFEFYMMDSPFFTLRLPG